MNRIKEMVMFFFRPKMKAPTRMEWGILGVIFGVFYFSIILLMIASGTVCLFAWISSEINGALAREAIFNGLFLLTLSAGMIWLWVKVIKPFFFEW